MECNALEYIFRIMKEKTCGKKQHVKIDIKKGMSNLMCCKFTVGRNYNSTHDTVNRVSVTVYGKVLDKNYTRLLHSNGDLDLKTVFLIDQVQKRKTISKDDYKSLRKSGLVEGRYPALYVSYKIAEAVGDKAGYIRNKGLDEKILKELIISASKNGPQKKADIYEAVKHAFPDVLTEEKQYKKLSNLLQKMKKEGVVDVRGSAVHAEWFLVE